LSRGGAARRVRCTIASHGLAHCGPLVMSDQPDSLAAVITQLATEALAKK